MLLEDKSIILTGAGQGIGIAYARKLAAEGARVVAVDINAEGVRRTAADIASQGGQIVTLTVDVTNPADVERMARETIERFGRIDAIVNNAALFTAIPSRPFWEIEPEWFDRVMAVNIKGVWLCSRAVFPYMKEQGGGKIVNVASGIFWSAKPGLAHYVASKGGVIGLTRAMAREAGEFNITVNAVAPGFTVTEVTSVAKPEAAAHSFRDGCLKRAERPDDLAGTVAFLCSNESDFITGQTIVVDGGRTLH